MARRAHLLARLLSRCHSGLQALILVGCSAILGWAGMSAAHASASTGSSTGALTVAGAGTGAGTGTVIGSASSRPPHQYPQAQHFRVGSTLSVRAQYCVGQAAAFHGVNADVLHAIILVESDGRPLVVNRNSNGTVDVGMAQINSIHFSELARYGIQPEHLFDECIAAFVAGWHYARQVRRLGNTWQAIGAYHSRTPHLNEAYQRRVMRRMVQLGVWAPTQAASALPQSKGRQ